MIRDTRPPDPDLEALLERARVIPPVSDVVRARALARARAAAAAASTPAPEYTVPNRAGRPSIAVAASIALLALIAGGTAAALFHHAPAPPPLPSSVRRAPPRVAAAVAERAIPPVVAPQPIALAKTRRPAHVVPPQESYAAELDLLRHAQAAYASRDFSNALVLVAEHGRRFPNGRLAEEREALRVRSLASSGHGGEARRAFDAFANRFPRSVLLPRLREAVGTAD
jgi:TolA-binding protein